MISIHRVLLMARKYFLSRFLRTEDLIDFSFWPLLDIVTWGGVGLMMGSAVPAGQANEQLLLFLLGVMMIRAFHYCYVSGAINFLYEMMAHNVVNLYSSPLRFSEWTVGAMIAGALSSGTLVMYATAVSWIIFKVNLLGVGPTLILFIIPLWIFAWASAHITIIILMKLGVHAQRLVFVMGWLFTPFSGVYYSPKIMPAWIQMVGRFVPTSYVFEGLRHFVATHEILPELFMYGYGLALIYLALALTASKHMFEYTRRLGLASLERT